MQPLSNKLTLDELFNLANQRLNALFDQYVSIAPSLELKLAMEYTLLNGGKRVRPLLVYATGAIFNTAWENLDVAAAAVEMIHTYSLIHDDLPCMDNADVRRGKPSCHKAYGESIAVLTGDALNTLAMHVIATHPATLTTNPRLQMIKVLSEASGPNGMVGGQALDISLMNDATISNDLLLNIYQLKTGALISACIELGRLASNDDDEFNQQALKEFGNCIGLAFQIQDDLLDIEGSPDLIGKSQSDLNNNKMTYPRLYGVSQAKLKVQSLYEEALEAINYLGGNAFLLRELIGFLLYRAK